MGDDDKLKKPAKRRRTSSASSAGKKRSKKRSTQGKKKKQNSSSQVSSNSSSTMNSDEENGSDEEVTKFQTLTKDQWDELTEKQKKQYEDFRRSHFQEAHVKRIMATVTDKPIKTEMAIVASTCAKMFVGEIVERARIAMLEAGLSEKEPIPKTYVRKAYEEMKGLSRVIFDCPTLKI
eukprot:g590.t1